MESILLTLVGVGLTDSRKIKRQLGAAGGAELSWRHERAVREALSTFPTGQELEKGLDSFLIGFPKPTKAVHFALLLQRRMRLVFADNPTPVLDSIVIHFGDVLFEPGAGALKIRSVFVTPVDLCKLLTRADNRLIAHATKSHRRDADASNRDGRAPHFNCKNSDLSLIPIVRIENHSDLWENQHHHILISLLNCQ